MIAGMRRRFAGVNAAEQHLQIVCDDIANVVFGLHTPLNA